MRWRVSVLVAAGALAASGAAAQLPRGLTLEGAAATARLRTTSTGGAEALSGPTLGAEAAFARRAVSLRVGYLQGRLTPDSGSPAARDLVEGWALVGYRPLAWLDLEGGAHARAWVTPAVTARRLFFELTARAEVPVVARDALVYVALTRAMAAGAGAGDAVLSARGGEGGLIVRPPRLPVTVRLAYRIDRTRLRAAEREETFDGVSLAVGFGGR